MFTYSSLNPHINIFSVFLAQIFVFGPSYIILKLFIIILQELLLSFLQYKNVLPWIFSVAIVLVPLEKCLFHIFPCVNHFTSNSIENISAKPFNVVGNIFFFFCIWNIMITTTKNIKFKDESIRIFTCQPKKSGRGLKRYIPNWCFLKWCN